jgi:tRNA dimethylallyltransferase
MKDNGDPENQRQLPHPSTESPTLIVIAGPTASGKTALALDLAQRLGTAIISADARQCYQGMAIGSAQPSAEEQAAVKHYFVNQFPVTALQSAASFEKIALDALGEIFAEGRTAIACGGSGLYLRALCEGLDEMPPVDVDIAVSVDAGYREHGIAWLQEALRHEDPAFSDGEALKNPARMMRALSFVRSTGRSILSYRSGRKKQRPFRILKFALDLPREELYARINARTRRMMEAGLPEEARRLLPYRHLPPLQTVGYAELFEHFDGKYTLDAAAEKIAQHTRNYAKRQLTWFRRDAEISWLPAGDAPQERILRALER